MKKNSGASSSIFSLWEKASKAKKTDETSTPNQTTAASTTCASPTQLESNLQLALVQAPDAERETAPPIIEDDKAIDEDDEQMQADLEALEHDPGKRIPISVYDVNDQYRVRRRYIEMGPCQPKNHKFEFTNRSGIERRFCHVWFKEFPWIEYSVEKDAAFCFVCYLFKDKTKSPGGDAFVKNGFRNWNMKLRLKKHEGDVSSAHAEAQEKYDMFTTPQTSIRESIASNTSQKQDEDIVHAIEVLDNTRFYLAGLRTDPGWDDFLQKVTTFCTKHQIKVVDMEGPYYPVGRPRRGFYKGLNNFHRFKVDMYVSVIDRQLSELNGRFDEVNTELLSCMAAFSPLHLFGAYDKEKLVKLATKFYANDFTSDWQDFHGN